MPGKRIGMGDLAGDATTNPDQLPSFATGSRAAKLDTIAPNPRNTRDLKRDPGKFAELVASIRVRGQMESCAAVTRSAFLAIFPEYADKIGTAALVQVTGGRRRLAAIELGLETLHVSVLDNLAESRATFIAATASENIDRDQLDPIEEALAVADLVAELGEQKAAAAQWGRTPAWATQRLNLLKLDPAVQAALRAGDISLRAVRDLHTLDPVEQLAALEAWRDRTAAPAAPPGQDTDAGQPSAPAPRQRLSPAASAFRRLGGTPSKIADVLRSQMQPDDITELIRLLTEQ